MIGERILRQIDLIIAVNQRGRHHFAGRAHAEIPARILAFDEKTAFDIAQLGPHHAHLLLELLAFQLAVLFLDFRMQGGKTVVVGNGRAQAFLAAGLQTPDDIHLLAPFRIVRPGAVEQPGINLHRNARPERVSEHRAQIAGPERPDEIDRLPVRYLVRYLAKKERFANMLVDGPRSRSVLKWYCC